MAEHTPGPWLAVAGDSVVNVVTRDLRRVAATNTKSYYERHDDADLANARLIAAAPELLEALEALTSSADCAAEMANVGVMDSHIDRARAVIAKARGDHA